MHPARLLSTADAPICHQTGGRTSPPLLRPLRSLPCGTLCSASPWLRSPERGFFLPAAHAWLTCQTPDCPAAATRSYCHCRCSVSELLLPRFCLATTGPWSNSSSLDPGPKNGRALPPPALCHHLIWLRPGHGPVPATGPFSLAADRELTECRCAKRMADMSLPALLTRRSKSISLLVAGTPLRILLPRTRVRRHEPKPYPPPSA